MLFPTSVLITSSVNICVVNVEGKYYEMGNVCTHEGGPLAAQHGTNLQMSI